MPLGGLGGYTSDSNVIGSGAIGSGDILTGGVHSGSIASGQVGSVHLEDGTVVTVDLGSGAVVSGIIASGQVGSHHLSSGSVQGYLGLPGASHVLSGTLSAFDIGDGQVTSGHHGSGQLSTYHFGSGATIRNALFSSPVASGTSWELVTEEAISGVRAVCVSQSGNLRIAMAAVSGRMPAIGVAIDNVLSGIPVNVYNGGLVFFTSGLFTGIAHFGQPVWVGRSGHLVPISGSFGSGGFASGDIGQKMGVAVTRSGSASHGSGAVLLSPCTVVWSGGPLGEATGGTV